MPPSYSLLPESWPDLARALVAEMVGRNINQDQYQYQCHQYQYQTLNHTWRWRWWSSLWPGWYNVPGPHRMWCCGQLEDELWCHPGKHDKTKNSFDKVDNTINGCRNFAIFSFFFYTGVFGFWTGCHGNCQLHWARQWRYGMNTVVHFLIILNTWIYKSR